MSGPETNKIINDLIKESVQLTDKYRNKCIELRRKYLEDDSINEADCQMKFVDEEIESEMESFIEINKMCEANRVLYYKIPIFILDFKIEFIEKFYLGEVIE